MNGKYRALTLILSVLIMLTFIPALAFAEDSTNDLNIEITDASEIEQVEIITAPDFEPRISIGQNDYISSTAFAGKGNKFVVTFTNGDKQIFEFVEDEDDYGFIDKSSNRYAHVTCDLKSQGITLQENVPTDLTFTFEYCSDIDENGTKVWRNKNFQYTLTAKTWAVIPESKNGNDRVYTGKVIDPEVTLKTVYGDLTIPDNAYEVKTSGFKSIGQHRFKIQIKDTDKYKPLTYTDDGSVIWLDFQIRPKNLKRVKTHASKRGFNVEWKKLSKAEQKNIDGIIIECSPTKEFIFTQKKYVKKNASSCQFKKLKKNKTYYVRVQTYKRTKVGSKTGKKYKLTSFSKIYKAKTK